MSLVYVVNLYRRKSVQRYTSSVCKSFLHFIIPTLEPAIPQMVRLFYCAMARAFSKAFYKSKEWQQCREYVLKRDNYLCVKCNAPAEEVHHIIHLSPKNIDDPKVTLNPANLKSLCKTCHFDEHKGERGMQRINEEKYPYCFNEYGELVRKASPG